MLSSRRGSRDAGRAPLRDVSVRVRIGRGGRVRPPIVMLRRSALSVLGVLAGGLLVVPIAVASPPSQTLSGAPSAGGIEGIGAQVSATLSGGAAGGSLHTFAPGEVGGGLSPLSSSPIGASNGTARLIVSADGAHVYATNRSDKAVSVYERGANGGLSWQETVSLEEGAYPEGIVESPDGRNVYVADFGTNAVTVFTTAGGGLHKGSEVKVGTTIGGQAPIGISISPDGHFVYVADSKSATAGQGAVSVYERMSDGALELVQEVPAGTSAHDVLVSPDGKNVYVANLEESTISVYTLSGGQLTLLETTHKGGPNRPHALAISPDGKSLYVTDDSANGEVVEFSRGTSGALTNRASVSTGKATENVAVSPDGNSVYATNFDSNNLSQFSRNAETGLLKPLSNAPGTGSNPEGVAISPDGANVYVANYAGGSTGSVSEYSRSLKANSFEGTVNCMVVGGSAAGPVQVTVEALGSGWYAPGQGQTRTQLPGSYRQVLTSALTEGGDQFALLNTNGLPVASGAPACSQGSFAALKADRGSSPLAISTSIAAPTDGAVSTNGNVTLSGSTEPGAQVAIYDGASQLAVSAKANADGQWSQPLSNLSAGSHLFSARSTTGNTATSNTVEVVVSLPATSTPTSTPTSAPTGGGSGASSPHGAVDGYSSGLGVSLSATSLRLVGNHLLLRLRAAGKITISISGYVKAAGSKRKLSLLGTTVKLATMLHQVELEVPASTLRVLRYDKRHHIAMTLWLTITHHVGAHKVTVSQLHAHLG